MQANVFPLHIPSTLEVGSKEQNKLFSESDHVAYQIKGKEAYNNIQATILPLSTPSTPGVGSKGVKIFFEGGNFAYQIEVR